MNGDDEQAVVAMTANLSLSDVIAADHLRSPAPPLPRRTLRSPTGSRRGRSTSTTDGISGGMESAPVAAPSTPTASKTAVSMQAEDSPAVALPATPTPQSLSMRQPKLSSVGHKVFGSAGDDNDDVVGDLQHLERGEDAENSAAVANTTGMATKTDKGSINATTVQPRTPARKLAPKSSPVMAAAITPDTNTAAATAKSKRASVGGGKSVQFAGDTQDRAHVKLRARDTPVRPAWNSRFAASTASADAKKKTLKKSPLAAPTTSSTSQASQADVRTRKTSAGGSSATVSFAAVASPRTPHVSQTNVKRQRQVSQLARPLLMPANKDNGGDNVFLVPQAPKVQHDVQVVSEAIKHGDEEQALSLIRTLRQELDEERKVTAKIQVQLQQALEAKSRVEMELQLLRDQGRA